MAPAVSWQSAFSLVMRGELFVRARSAFGDVGVGLIEALNFSGAVHCTTRRQPGSRGARAALMLTYMLDTNICIYVMKNYPPDLRESSMHWPRTLHLNHHAR
jgi:hypothetical protein